MLKGRLGLETARIPHADRHGLLWLSRGKLSAEDGSLRFLSAGDGELPAGDFSIPFQMISCVVLGPGTTVTHDVLRLLARHGTGLLATGQGGVRLYASMPFGPDDSALAREQVRCWFDPEKRLGIARKMYAWRLGEILPSEDINVLRGIEGARMKETYKRLAAQYKIQWDGRRYDRQKPELDSLPNQAINHAVTAVEAAAMVATASTSAIPQLGFIHEDSSNSFCLDLADLFRDTITLPVAFMAVREVQQKPGLEIERVARQMANRVFREKKLIHTMIERVKDLFPSGAEKSTKGE
jgi:CRISPR-associated protein Cas1